VTSPFSSIRGNDSAVGTSRAKTRNLGSRRNSALVKIDVTSTIELMGRNINDRHIGVRLLKTQLQLAVAKRKKSNVTASLDSSFVKQLKYLSFLKSNSSLNTKPKRSSTTTSSSSSSLSFQSFVTSQTTTSGVEISKEVVISLRSAPPSVSPTVSPSTTPSTSPSGKPSGVPSGKPSAQSTGEPSGQPTDQPSEEPTGQPSLMPSENPTTQPTGLPSAQPSSHPSGQPSAQPSSQPSGQPTGQPSIQPTNQPSNQPTGEPTDLLPTGQPSGQPTSGTKLVIVTSSYDLRLSGLQASTFGDNEKTAFKATVATVCGVSSSAVVITSVTDAATSSRYSGHLFAEESTLLVVVAFSVDVVVSPWSDASAANTLVNTALSNSLSDGSFDTTLHSVASLYGSNTLDTASAPSSGLTIIGFHKSYASVQPTAQPNTQPYDTKRKSKDKEKIKATKSPTVYKIPKKTKVPSVPKEKKNAKHPKSAKETEEPKKRVAKKVGTKKDVR